MFCYPASVACFSRVLLFVACVSGVRLVCVMCASRVVLVSFSCPSRVPCVSLSFALCDPCVSLSCVSRGCRMSRICDPCVSLSCVPPLSLSCPSRVPFVSLGASYVESRPGLLNEHPHVQRPHAWCMHFLFLHNMRTIFFSFFTATECLSKLASLRGYLHKRVVRFSDLIRCMFFAFSVQVFFRLALWLQLQRGLHPNLR